MSHCRSQIVADMNLTTAFLISGVIVWLLVQLSKPVGNYLISRPILYDTHEEYEHDDPNTSPKWFRFRLGVRILGHAGTYTANVGVRNPPGVRRE